MIFEVMKSGSDDFYFSFLVFEVYLFHSYVWPRYWALCSIHKPTYKLDAAPHIALIVVF